MRVLSLVLLVASGCSLYLGHPGEPPDAIDIPDAGIPGTGIPDAGIPDAGPPSASYRGDMARCEDGQLYVAPVFATWPDAPGHGAGVRLGRCRGTCRSAAVQCVDDACTNAKHALCEAPVSLGAICPLQGTACAGSGSIACPETTGCSVPVPGSSCTCTAGAYQCTQLTPAAEIQARLVGKWRGMVTTPGFAPPYPITLWIYPDGSYWAEQTGAGPYTAFYYGGDGPSPARKIEILSTSETVGSFADIAIDFGLLTPSRGTLTSLSIDATTLRFSFTPSWVQCNSPFEFNLTRY